VCESQPCQCLDFNSVRHNELRQAMYWNRLVLSIYCSGIQFECRVVIARRQEEQRNYNLVSCSETKCQMRITIREMADIKLSSRRLSESAGYMSSDGLHHSRRTRQFVDHD
jgi:hypothetical protein